MPALVKVADAQRIQIGIGRPAQECTGMEAKSGLKRHLDLQGSEHASPKVRTCCLLDDFLHGLNEPQAGILCPATHIGPPFLACT